MSEIKPFSYTMIETCLRDHKIRFLRDEENDIVVQFRYDPDCACELTFYLMAQGEKQEIYTLLCRSNRRFGTGEWERALVLSNTWNRERRWPKSYLRSFGENGAAYGELCLEEHIDLEAGIHQELLSSFTMNFFASSFSFWRWLHQEQHF